MIIRFLYDTFRSVAFPVFSFVYKRYINIRKYTLPEQIFRPTIICIKEISDDFSVIDYEQFNNVILTNDILFSILRTFIKSEFNSPLDEKNNLLIRVKLSRFTSNHSYLIKLPDLLQCLLDIIEAEKYNILPIVKYYSAVEKKYIKSDEEHIITLNNEETNVNCNFFQENPLNIPPKTEDKVIDMQKIIPYFTPSGGLGISNKVLHKDLIDITLLPNIEPIISPHSKIEFISF